MARKASDVYIFINNFYYNFYYNHNHYYYC